MFSLPDLPYDYDALSPVISEETMQFHHDKHHATYVKTLNDLLEASGQSFDTLEAVIADAAGKTPKKLFNNAAQTWNHAFFWECMTPEKQTPSGDLAAAIDSTFGGHDKLKEAFVTGGVDQFGSGWVWLVADKAGALKIVSTHDADNTPVGRRRDAADRLRRLGARLLPRLPEPPERLPRSLVRRPAELGSRRPAVLRGQGVGQGLDLRRSRPVSDVAPPKDIRLALVDVDGTLVTKDKILTPRAIAAAEGLRKAGVKLALTSGRPPRGMAMLIEPLKIDTPIAGFNGGAFVNPDLSVIDAHPLDADAAHQALDLILKQGLDAWLYTADDWFIRKQDAPHVDREAWTVKFDAKVTPEYSDAEIAKAVKIVGVSDDLELVAKCEKAVQDALGDKASAARSQPYYLDVTSPLANKGEVVIELAKRLNIPASSIMTFGDMPNDVNMFAKSGFSIAMGNSSDEVKAKASATTDSNEDDGFAKAVERFILEPLAKAR